MKPLSAFYLFVSIVKSKVLREHTSNCSKNFHLSSNDVWDIWMYKCTWKCNGKIIIELSRIFREWKSLSAYRMQMILLFRCFQIYNDLQWSSLFSNVLIDHKYHLILQSANSTDKYFTWYNSANQMITSIYM